MVKGAVNPSNNSLFQLYSKSFVDCFFMPLYTCARGDYLLLYFSKIRNKKYPIISKYPFDNLNVTVNSADECIAIDV